MQRGMWAYEEVTTSKLYRFGHNHNDRRTILTLYQDIPNGTYYTRQPVRMLDFIGEFASPEAAMAYAEATFNLLGD